MSISESNTPNKAYEQTIRLGRAQSCLHTVVETIGTDKEERELEKDLEADAFRFTNAWNSRGSAVRGAIIVGGVGKVKQEGKRDPQIQFRSRPSDTPSRIFRQTYNPLNQNKLGSCLSMPSIKVSLLNSSAWR